MRVEEFNNIFAAWRIVDTVDNVLYRTVFANQGLLYNGVYMININKSYLGVPNELGTI